MSRYISKSVNVGMGGGVTTQTISEESKNGFYTIDEAERILGLRFRPELKKFLTNTPSLPVGAYCEFTDLSRNTNISVVEATLELRRTYDHWGQKWFFDVNWVAIDGGLGNGDYTIFDNLTGKVGIAYHDAPASFKDGNSYSTLAGFVKEAQKFDTEIAAKWEEDKRKRESS